MSKNNLQARRSAYDNQKMSPQEKAATTRPGSQKR